MKKIEFLRLVCIELARMGVGEAEIKIQCQNTYKYLTKMGIAEESEILDREDPAAFAKLICSNIAKRQQVQTQPPVQEPPKEEPVVVPPSTLDLSEELPDVGAIEEVEKAPEETDVAASSPSIEVNDAPEDEDIKIFSGNAPTTEPVEPQPAENDVYEEPVLTEEPVFSRDISYGSAADESRSTYTHNISRPEPENGTIEFNAVKARKNLPPKEETLDVEEDYFEKNDEEDYIPTGNPVLFWVLVCLTSFLWIPLALLFLVGVALGIVLMILFEALYIPAMIVIIIGGSAVSFAELIYSIIRFAGKSPSIAIFEMGLGFIVAALTVGLPAGMYFLGVNVFPGYIKNYGRNVKKLTRKLRRLYRRLKGACSI